MQDGGSNVESRRAFPLYERAREAGVLDGESALIVAPTATGKSHIGREALAAASRRGAPGTHAYLVPFRALAGEVFETLRPLFEASGARVRIATGDHTDPIRPDETDVLVGTYESFSGLLRSDVFRPGYVVADEIHLIADETRGAFAEGLLARLLAPGRAAGLCALSAVVENGRELAEWLGVRLVEGTAADREIHVDTNVVFTGDIDRDLAEEIRCCFHGDQALVFCASRAGAERAARDLAPLIAPHVPSEEIAELNTLAEAVLADDPDAERLAELLPRAVAYHHAGLPRTVRERVEDAYRRGLVRLIACTPTLAAGVNLPAHVAIVRDVFRTEFVRGRPVPVLLSSADVLNMLGRAGRPGQVERGRGTVLIQSRVRDDAGVKLLTEAVDAGRGAFVRSRLPASFDTLMRFVLAEVVERREAGLHDLAAVWSRTLAHRERPEEVRFDREFREDLMEDLPGHDKAVREGIRTTGHHVSAEGVHADVLSKGRVYHVSLGIDGAGCDCPAASRWYRGKTCKHVACAVHDLLFGDAPQEARDRAIYSCVHLFGKTLDAGTRLAQATRLLDGWGLIERTAGGWRATPVGGVATATTRDLLLVHNVVYRTREANRATYRELARWAVIDFFPDPDEERWLRAIEPWLDEVDYAEIRPKPVRYRGDFDARLDDLERVCRLFEGAARALGKDAIADAAHQAAGAVRYGVKPELVPLRALRIPQLGRARCRYLYDEHGVRGLADLATADPARVAHARRAPQALVREWVQRAREIHDARATASADVEFADPELDELVARFRIDPDALFPS
ncbi:MAG: DEAD/DEAH box helicase [Streptosporangiales bacterium]|nr:DEAD/DEAH box helicase [Streptosporangiales bacterium]